MSSTEPEQAVAQPKVEDTLSAETSQLAIDNNEGEEVPAHRSHDPAKNKKRSDPFQFGSRYLTEQDDVFEFNAWDHVETDGAYKEFAESQYAMQRQSPVSDYDKGMLAGFSLCLTILV